MKFLKGFWKYFVKISRKLKFIIKFPGNLENLAQTLEKFDEF